MPECTLETDFRGLSSLGWKAKMSEIRRLAQEIGYFNLESYAFGVACELREALKGLIEEN